MMSWLCEYWRNVMQSVLASLALVFLLIESYEVVTDQNITLSFVVFLFAITVVGVTYFLIDGYFWSGFLKKEIVITNHNFDTKIKIKFGNFFEQDGWKAIGVNDFFDSHVDEELISSQSLHGYVINNYWPDRRDDWQKQIGSTLKTAEIETVNRPKGNKRRYPIGTTGYATWDDNKFLFVALSETDVDENVVSSNAEQLIAAIRGMLRRARSVCSYEPLSIPLMGSGLARIGIKNSVLLDLIITAILEETRHGRVTGEVSVIVPVEKKNQINLQNHVRNWNNGK